MLVVGLSGGIASGKSTVSNLLKSHKLPLVDLDVLARDAVAPGSYALSRLVQHFGAERILKDDGSLNREALGSIVFEDEKERKVLNGIVHPAVRRLLAWEVVKYWVRGEKVVVVDAPLLVEAGLWRLCGLIVIVYCSEQLQLQRLQLRNNLSAHEARSRLAAQRPLGSKLIYADVVLDNSGSTGDLNDQVDRLVRRIRGQSGGMRWALSWLVPPLGLFYGALIIAFRLLVKGVGQDNRKRGTKGTSGGKTDDPNEIELRKLKSRPQAGLDVLEPAGR